MKNKGISKIERLLKKGVKIPNPGTVDIGDDVVVDKISGNGVTIYSGCKIFGRSTLILHGVKLGYEGPVTIENCQVGPLVELKGGFCRESVFLKKVIAGFGSHIRDGTILEEESSVSHMVGLKQTILFPFVTLGSLINFCDCFMSGGTGRKDHSEVGSSYVHFNYTPNQDKATPSLIGDVPYGVMLNQKPIFLGGQGGLAGPCRLAFGVVTSAGTICRKDELRRGRLILEENGRNKNILFIPGKYRNVKRIVVNNIVYISNLIALMQWYIHVRSQFISDDFPDALAGGLKEKLNMAIDERVKKLKEFFKNISQHAKTTQEIAKEKEQSLFLQQKNELYDRCFKLEEFFKEQRFKEGDRRLGDAFMERVDAGIRELGKNYIPVIKSLEGKDAKTGTLWLQGIVDQITVEALKIVPTFD